MSFFAELQRRNVFRVTAAYGVTGWLIIQVAETVLPAFGFGDAAIRLVVIVFAIGLIPVIVLAWAFELTPQGLKLDRGLDLDQRASPRATRTLDRVIMMVLALALGFFAFDKFVLDPRRDARLVEDTATQVRSESVIEAYGDASIAVLPFTSLGSDPEQQFFTDGITEELLNLLARIEGLRVISRTSAFQYRDSDKSVTEIATELKVAHVLEGSVRRAGNVIRITVQLIEARADTHLWSETYDRNLEDIFAIQDEVAAQVVDQLKVRMSVGTPTSKRHDAESYTLYLKAQQLLRLEGDDPWGDLDRAEQLLLQALDRDPRFADAKVALGWVYWWRSGRASGPQDAEQEAFRARQSELLDEVAASDPDNASLHVARAWQAPGDFPLVAHHIARALQLEPRNEYALNSAMLLMTRLGRFPQAQALGEFFRARDPVAYYAHRNLAEVYVESRQLELAEETYRTAVSMFPDANMAHWRLGLVLLFRGKTESALEQFQNEALAEPILKLHGTALALHDLGRHDEAQAALARLVETAGNEWSYDLACAYAWIGDVENAFRQLDAVPSDYLHLLTLDLRSPFFDRIRDDPRWLAFLTRIGASPEQLDEVEFDIPMPR